MANFDFGSNFWVFVSDAAGTESQIKHVSRLLAAQMTALGVGPGVKEIREKRSQMPLPKIGPDSDEERERAEIGVDPIEESRKRKVQLVPAGMTTKKATLKKSLKLGKFKIVRFHEFFCKDFDTIQIYGLTNFQYSKSNFWGKKSHYKIRFIKKFTFQIQDVHH